MRSLLLVLFVLGLLAAPEAQAQLQFGARAGLNVSDFANDGAGASDPRLGFHAGVTAMYPFAASLFIRPEVLYSQKGAGYTEGGGDLSFNIDYLDVPVLIGYTLPTQTNLLLHLYAGPQLSVKLSESSRTEGVGVDIDLIRDTDFGLVVGGDIGARRVGSTSSFGVGLRYTIGLTDIADFPAAVEPPSTTRSGLHNRVFSVSAFYTF
jgi:hypothetical protein